MNDSNPPGLPRCEGTAHGPAGGRRPMKATIADDAERAELWPRLVAMYKGYADYQTKTAREIPVIVLTPR